MADVFYELISYALLEHEDHGVEHEDAVERVSASRHTSSPSGFGFRPVGARAVSTGVCSRSRFRRRGVRARVSSSLSGRAHERCGAPNAASRRRGGLPLLLLVRRAGAHAFRATVRGGARVRGRLPGAGRAAHGHGEEVARGPARGQGTSFRRARARDATTKKRPPPATASGRIARARAAAACRAASLRGREAWRRAVPILSRCAMVRRRSEIGLGRAAPCL